MMYWPRKAEAIKKLRQFAGVVPLSHFAAGQKAWFDYVVKACTIFWQPYMRSGKLIYIHLYNRQEQGRPFNEFYGICNHYWDNTVTIGLSTDALDAGRYCAIVTLLHEIAHLKYEGHERDFDNHFNEILVRYNRISGSHINLNDVSCIAHCDRRKGSVNCLA